jgi:predicted membrane protein
MDNSIIRIGSFALASILSTLILIFPQGLTNTQNQAEHGVLMFLLLAIMVGFIHGVGFKFKTPIWHYLISPLTAWPITIWGIILIALKVELL